MIVFLRFFVTLFALEGLAIGALGVRGVHFVRAHFDRIQRAIITVGAMIAALLNRALNRLVLFASVVFHKGTSS